ncbi:MAG: DUF2769 domain-containing protein [Deltaproteobacteria bacterium]|nr:DUF2769 domain-containing protein [Deltaproteobacteria bacterium]
MSKYETLDKFGVENLEEADFKKRQDYILKNCRCTKCPTYVQGDAPTGYCYPAFGTSKQIHWEKECVCKTCSIFKEYELTHSFYCTRCSQFCQGLKIEVAGGQGGSG